MYQMPSNWFFYIRFYSANLIICIFLPNGKRQNTLCQFLVFEFDIYYQRIKCSSFVHCGLQPGNPLLFQWTKVDWIWTLLLAVENTWHLGCITPLCVCFCGPFIALCTVLWSSSWTWSSKLQQLNRSTENRVKWYNRNLIKLESYSLNWFCISLIPAQICSVTKHPHIKRNLCCVELDSAIFFL